MSENSEKAGSSKQPAEGERRTRRRRRRPRGPARAGDGGAAPGTGSRAAEEGRSGERPSGEGRTRRRRGRGQPPPGGERPSQGPQREEQAKGPDRPAGEGRPRRGRRRRKKRPGTSAQESPPPPRAADLALESAPSTDEAAADALPPLPPLPKAPPDLLLPDEQLMQDDAAAVAAARPATEREEALGADAAEAAADEATTAAVDGEQPEAAAADEVSSESWPYYESEKELDGRVVNAVVVQLSGASTRRFDAGEQALQPGQRVLVETDRGLALGVISRPPRRELCKEVLSRVVRILDEDDGRATRLAEREAEAYQICRERIRERELPMKLLHVEYMHSGNKATFYFSAENRVDFRELVKDLARKLHLRVEMRQVGVRDESRIAAGMGPCGQPLCCSTWIKDFHPVSIRMAKDQNLVLNPSKVSGMCGRLKCCLAYEQALYREARQSLPKVGQRVETPAGPGRVHEVDIPRRLVRVLGQDGSIATFDAKDVSRDLPEKAPSAEPPSADGP